MKNIILVLVAVVVFGGLAWWGMNQNAPVAHEGAYKVGVMLPMTGDGAVYGEPMVRMIQLAAEEINAAGGINGDMIELVVEDDKCDGTNGASAIQKLINVDKVQVVIGSACSGASLAAVPIAEQAKVVLLSPGASSPKLTGISPYFARNYPSDAAQGAVLANVAYTDKGLKTVAIVQEQTDYAQGVYTAFKTEFEKLGGTTTVEPFPTETTDFRSLVTKVKSQNPDAVLLSVQTPASGARILAQMKQLGWKPVLLASDVIPGDPKTLTDYKDMLEGALVAEFGVDPSNPKFAAILAAHREKYGSELSYQPYGQTSYDAVYIVKEALMAVGYDGTKIAKWLRTNVKNWQGASGSVTIQDNGELAAGHRAEVIINGKVQVYSK